MSGRHVVLLGLMGAGKTSLGRRVGRRLDRPLVDGDDELEARTGHTARELADAEGLDALHVQEAEIALAALARADPVVLGPAASVVESSDVRHALQGHHLVWLTGPVEVLARKAAEKGHRPLVDEPDLPALVARQLAVRQPLAVDLGALVLDITSASKDDLADRIVDHVTT